MAKAAGRRRKNAKSKRKTKAARPTARPTTRPTAGTPTRAARTAKAGAGPPGRVIAPWWERWPGRLKWELKQLTAKGLQVDIDEASRQRQQVVLRVVAPAAGENHTFTVVFSDFYPELRPQVYCETLELPRHQNPIDKNLCLLDRSTRDWGPKDSVAWLLTERVPKLLQLLNDSEEMHRAEAPQGEPFTDYYRYRPSSTLFIPGFALELPRKYTSGRFRLRLEPGAGTTPIRALLYQVSDDHQHVLGEAEPQLADNFSEQTIEGRWLRLNEPPRAADAAQIVQFLAEKHPEAATSRFLPTRGRNLDVIGLVFPEEVTQDRYEDAWLLLVRELTGHQYLCRGQRITEQDLLARTPELAVLRRCKVGIIGLGGLGAPSALEFARCQVGELRLLDHDIVEAGTTIRWPFGLRATGHLKAQILGEYIKANYPFVRLESYSGQIGRAALGKQQRSERELLSEFLDGLDMIYDATAEYGVQYLLSNLARDWEVPQIYVSGTEGGWGGMVTRCIPGKTGCWLCWKHHLDDESLPLPSLKPGGMTQPRGCATRTFTGTGFDLLPIVAQGVRLAVQTLAERSDSEGSCYPASDHDISVLYLRDATGNPTGCPRWEHHKLEIHPRCEFCAKT